MKKVNTIHLAVDGDKNLRGDKSSKRQNDPYLTLEGASRFCNQRNFGPKAFKNFLTQHGFIDNHGEPIIKSVRNEEIKIGVRNDKKVLLIKASMVVKIGITFSLFYPTGFPRKKAGS